MKNRKPIKLPLGLAFYFYKEGLETEFITYLKLRSLKHFHNFSYPNLAKYLKVHKSTAKRHIKKLEKHGLVSFNSTKTLLTPIGCEKAKQIFAQTNEERKVISIDPMEKSLCLKFIIFRSNIRQQEYNQNKITNIAKKLADKNISVDVKKKLYKKSKSAKRKLSTEFLNNRSSEIDLVDEYAHIGISHQGLSNIISKSKITARRFIKKVSDKKLIKVKQKFVLSKKTFSRSEFNYLKRFELIPYYSKLLRGGVIGIQLYNQVSLVGDLASR